MNNNQPLNLLSIENKSIEECIYNIRGQQVMLDSDVVFFFGVTVSSLNRQTRRNVDRFPSDFSFQQFYVMVFYFFCFALCQCFSNFSS